VVGVYYSSHIEEIVGGDNEQHAVMYYVKIEKSLDPSFYAVTRLRHLLHVTKRSLPQSFERFMDSSDNLIQ
jgi:hypothetical protein